MASPRLEIDLEKIAQNAHTLSKYYSTKGISIIGVCKALCGDPVVARILLSSGINTLGDSRIKNIKRMRRDGIKAPLVLIRTPLKSELKEVIQYCQISHNTEYSIIQVLSELSLKRNEVHKIILMVELGDLREGILPNELPAIVDRIKKLKGVKIVGLGSNLACYGGIELTDSNMGKLSDLTTEVEFQLGYKLTYVSGGNSANYQWSLTTDDNDRINYLRLGEAILLGDDPLTRKPIPHLHTDVFTLIAEVIESGIKPSIPTGKQHQNAFGDYTRFKDNGPVRRAILGIGQQDVEVSGLKSRMDYEILGASSDHLIVNTQNKIIKIGEELKFDVNYAALLAATTSPFVTIKHMNTLKALEYCKMVEQKDRELKLLWPSMPIKENNSPLVSLKNNGFELIYEPSFRKDYQYLVREEIVEKIGRISQLLQSVDKRLIIRSAWRSFEHQQMIWDRKVKYLSREYPNKTMEEIRLIVSHYVAPSEKSMHSTGGAVDGLIYDLKSDQVLDFGTNKGLDIDLNEKCFPYHPDISVAAAKNRKLLISLFENEGFICDNKEYWHFDFGNAVWATKKKEKNAIYGVVGAA